MVTDRPTDLCTIIEPRLNSFGGSRKGGLDRINRGSSSSETENRGIDEEKPE